MKFTIEILTKNGKFYIEDLSEKECREVIVQAYDDISKLKKWVRFNDEYKIKAEDLLSFIIS